MKLVKIRRKENIDFGAKKPSMPGLASCGLFIIEVGILLAAVIYSYRHEGNAEPALGFVGLADVILGFSGIYLGYHGQKKNGRINHRPDVTGLILNLLMIISVAVIYIVGTTLI